MKQGKTRVAMPMSSAGPAVGRSSHPGGGDDDETGGEDHAAGVVDRPAERGLARDRIGVRYALVGEAAAARTTDPAPDKA